MEYRIKTVYVCIPTFHFTEIRGCKKYRYDAVDENGAKHSFEAEDCCVSLASVQYPMVTGGTIVFSTLIDLIRKEKVSKREITATIIAFVSSCLMAI